MGYYNSDPRACPSTTYEIKCSAEGYKSATKTVTTDASGNANVRFDLEPLPPRCSGTISGHVFDAKTGKPISGAVQLILPNGPVKVEDVSSPVPSDDSGYFGQVGVFCPSTAYEITSSAEGYESKTQTVTTDNNGNVDVRIDLEPKCSGTISGHVFDAKTGTPMSGAVQLIIVSGPVENGSSRSAISTAPTDDSGYFSQNGTFCPNTAYEITSSAEGHESKTQTVTTDNSGNADVRIDLEPKCTGTISGHVYDAKTNSPVTGATLLICQKGGDCWSPAPVDSTGVYSTDMRVCPSTTFEITCSAEGYKQANKTVTTDEKGNAWQDFPLEPESKCKGIISGHIKDANNGSPISSAVVIIFSNGLIIKVDSDGDYNTGKSWEEACPSTGYDLTCSANGYIPLNFTITTDGKGNAQHDFLLEPECKGTISGKVEDSLTNKPVQGATIKICQNGRCSDPVVADSAGRFSFNTVCPLITYNITCSAPGYLTYQNTGTTDDKGKSVHEILLEPECKGVISGKVEDSLTNKPVQGATIKICQNGRCSDPIVTDSSGQYTFSIGCPSITYNISCSAPSYITYTNTGTTDGKGSSVHEILLEPECKGTISGKVEDSLTNKPVQGATIKICQNGRCSDPVVTDSAGQYSFNKGFPSITYNITCSSPGYITYQNIGTTDNKGNSLHEILLEPECKGTVSGKVEDSLTNKPVQGATIKICQNGRCSDSIVTDSAGRYTFSKGCSSITYNITCSAPGYITYQNTGTTDNKGNSIHEILLEPECKGTISGKVEDSLTNKPVQGASIKICQNGSCSDPVVTDSAGQYTFSKGCPSITYNITCSAPGYLTYQNTGTTDYKGNSLHEILLEPECEGTISGKVEDSLTNKPVQGATIKICQNGRCADPIVTDSAGQYTFSKGCPSITYNITCSAPGYITYQNTGTTDNKGNSLHEILLEPECKGTISGKVEDSLTNKPVQGATTKICQNGKCSDPIVTDSAGQYSFGKGCPSITYNITCSAPGYITYQNTGTTDNKGNSVHEILLERGLNLKVWTDKSEYRVGEEVTIHYETGVAEAGRRIIVTQQGVQPPFTKTFGENSFAKEASGTRTLTLNSSGIYGVKLQAWTSSENKEATCKFDVTETPLALKVWTDKPEYGVGEEVTIHYETGSENAGRRIIVTQQGVQPPFTKTFGENSFAKEASGTRTLTLNSSGTYEARLQSWTGKENKEATCKFNVTVTENTPPTIISLNATPKSPQTQFAIKMIGFVVVTAKATDPDGYLLKYRFELRKKAEDFKVANDWDVIPMWIWNPTAGGDYDIRVKVTDGKSEVNKTINYNITNRKSAVWLDIKPIDQVPAGSLVSCMANVFDLESDPIQYKFWLKGPSTNDQWQAKTDWITEPTDNFFGQHTWNWTTSAQDIGKNEIKVWVRDGNHAGPESYDAYNESSYEVTNAPGPNNTPLNITSLLPNPPSLQDVQKSPSIMWIITASNPGNDALKYQFELRKKGSDFSVAQEFSTMRIWNWQPSEAGDYEIKGSVQNSKGQTATKVVEYSITDSKTKEIKFDGTLYRSNALTGSAVYYFKVDKILGDQSIPIGDPIGVGIYDSAKPVGQGGNADTLQEGDKADVYALFDADKGKYNDGFETAWHSSITEDKKYYVKKIGSENQQPNIIVRLFALSGDGFVGKESTFMVLATDPENDPLTYEFFVDGVSQAKQPGKGIWKWTPDSAKTYKIKVAISDGKHDNPVENQINFVVSGYTLNLEVKNAGGNNMPSCGGTIEVSVYDTKKNAAIEGLPNKHDYTGGAPSIKVSFKDLSSDSVRISILHTPKRANSDLTYPSDITENWGSKEFSLKPNDQNAITFIRCMPWIRDIDPSGKISFKNDAENDLSLYILYYYSNDKKVITSSGNRNIKIPTGKEDFLELPTSTYLYEYIQLHVNGYTPSLVDQWDWTCNPASRIPLDKMKLMSAGADNYSKYTNRLIIDLEDKNVKNFGEKIRVAAYKHYLETLKNYISEKDYPKKMITDFLSSADSEDLQNLELFLKRIPEGGLESAVIASKATPDDTDVKYIKNMINNLINIPKEVEDERAGEDLKNSPSFTRNLKLLNSHLLRETGLWEEKANICELVDIWNQENKDMIALGPSISEVRYGSNYEDAPIWNETTEFMNGVQSHIDFCLDQVS